MTQTARIDKRQYKRVILGRLTLDLYSGSYLAQVLHRKLPCIRMWERNKVIPKPVVQTKDGWRWYTKEEIDIYERLVEEEQVKNGSNIAKTDFTKRVFGEIAAFRTRLLKEAGVKL